MISCCVFFKRQKTKPVIAVLRVSRVCFVKVTTHTKSVLQHILCHLHMMFVLFCHTVVQVSCAYTNVTRYRYVVTHISCRETFKAPQVHEQLKCENTGSRTKTELTCGFSIERARASYCEQSRESTSATEFWDQNQYGCTVYDIVSTWQVSLFLAIKIHTTQNCKIYAFVDSDKKFALQEILTCKNTIFANGAHTTLPTGTSQQRAEDAGHRRRFGLLFVGNAQWRVRGSRAH